MITYDKSCNYIFRYIEEATHRIKFETTNKVSDSDVMGNEFLRDLINVLFSNPDEYRK